jgi:hypothetical protein
LDKLTSKTDQLVAQYNAGKTSRDKALAQRKKISGDVAGGKQAIQVGLTNAKEEIAILDDARDESSLTSAQRRQLQQEIDEWQGTVKQLKASNAQYEKLDGRLGV